MGMFDYVKVRCPIPEWMSGVDEWQTKDFDRWLETYEISEDGRLKDPHGNEMASATSLNFYGFSDPWYQTFVDVIATFENGKVIKFEKINRFELHKEDSHANE